MNVKFTQELELPEGFKGTVTVEIPPHQQRLRVLASTGGTKLKQQAEGATDAEKLELFEKNAPILLDVYEHARKVVAGCQVVHVQENGVEVVVAQSLDELERHPATSMAPLQIAAQYLAGYGPGNA